MGRLDLHDVHRDEDDSVDQPLTSEAPRADKRPLTEIAVGKLEVKPGDIVLVLYPEDYPDDLNALFDSFADLAQECGATFFGVPNTLKFKVVCESEAA